MFIRPEQPSDAAAVRAVNTAAFDSPAEAKLVDAVRRQCAEIISLVADENGAIIGHILLSPVTLTGHPELNITGLAPMAVAPEHQRKGVGSALVRAGLERCRVAGVGAIVVLGHPAYYPRFGFTPASRFGIRCEYDAPDEAFMAIELQPGYLLGASGIVKYHAAFNEV